MIRLAVFLVLIAVSSHAKALDLNHPALQKVINELIKENSGYSRVELNDLFEKASVDEKALSLMMKPAESLSWYQYRDLILTKERIKNGREFYLKHSRLLEQAERDFGVSAAVLVAVLGIETHYGGYMGKHLVFDSLVTLTAFHERRGPYFGRELKAFLKLMRAEPAVSINSIGSHAGAMGMPQFMPGSYAAYAVDYNNNGVRDIFFEVEDVLGSIGFYLKKHGWKRGEEVMFSLNRDLPSHLQKKASKKINVDLDTQKILKQGNFVSTKNSYNLPEKTSIVKLSESEKKDVYYLVFHNLKVLMRYNTSLKYALAVALLAQAIVENTNN